MSGPPKLSLYAHLLGENKQEGATISAAPVKYDAKAEEEKKKDASLQFQPIKRPQVQKSKPKPKGPQSSSSLHKFSSSTNTASFGASDNRLTSSTPQQPPSIQKSTFEDWIGGDDDEFYYDNRQRQDRGGKRKNQRKKGKGQETRTWDWDDIYDPTLPNNYADYKGSEEQFREIRDWKARLYYHQLKEHKKKPQNGTARSDEEEDRPRPQNTMFAPPSNLSFAPPSLDNVEASPQRQEVDDEDDYYPPEDHVRRDSDSRQPAPNFAPASTMADETGDDAYMRRMQMSSMTAPDPTSTPPPPAAVPTPPPMVSKPDMDIDAKRAEALAKIAAFKAKLQKHTSKAEVASAPPPQPVAKPPSVLETPPPPPPPLVQEPGTISREPVRYNIPPPPIDGNGAATANEPDTESAAEQAEFKKQGKKGKGFGERLLKKYGWEKGQGLGAQGEGITTALIGKADKRKKRADADGGGWAQPRNMGKIVGGKRRKIDGEDEASHGQMSDVIKLEGMLVGLDVQKEIEDNNLMQEIGDDMGENYGNVERVFIWREEMGGQNEVFVKFTSQLSAVRAVNATDGITFEGNDVVASFFDSEKFEKGEYV